MKKISIIGFGAITHMLLNRLNEHDPEKRVVIDYIMVRKNRLSTAKRELADKIKVSSSINLLIQNKPDLIVECAGQNAVKEYGPKILRSGINFMIISTGALVDKKFYDDLIFTAKEKNSKIIIPSGAIAGIDGLGSLKKGGLKNVRYISTKPPIAWRGTPAEKNFDLDNIKKPTSLFKGTASKAAELFPKNANLAATVALAGVGMQKTEVELVADPTVSPNNIGSIQAEGEFGSLKIECRSLPAPNNPKTSASTALSLTYAILKNQETLVI